MVELLFVTMLADSQKALKRL